MADSICCQTLQSWMTMSDWNSDSAKNKSLLIVDTRPYISYNNGHIIGACNMYCPPILKRRFARGGQVHIESMLGCETKNRLINGQFSGIVVYDQDGQSSSLQTQEQGQNVTDNAVDTSDLNIVFQTLCKLAKDTTCLVLKGGYANFKQLYPTLCTNYENPQRPNLAHAQQKPERPSSLSFIFGGGHSTTAEPVELLTHLYIGNSLSAAGKEALLRHGITAILNVSNNCQNHFDADFRYKNIPVDDNPLEDLSSWFTDAISFIDDVKLQGGKTLVHCQAGISRSATICLAYVMQSQRLTLDAAFEFVKSRRNVISPNISFMQQLLDFEKEIQRQYTPPASPCHLLSASSPGFAFFGQDDLPSPYTSGSQLQSPLPVLQSPVMTFT